MHPSGEQVELRCEDQRAVVVEVGGGLRRYDVGDRAVLDGYAADEQVTAARGQVLVPWPNRLHTGRYTWDGTEHVVPLDEPDQANALHGLARWRSWALQDRTPSSVTARLRLLPQPAYPFAVDVATRYELGPRGLTVTTAATNVGDQDAPWGSGAHPYVTVGTDLVDDAVLHVPARTWLPTGPGQVPLGRDSVEGTPYDFRAPRRIGRVHVDHAYTDLERDVDGRATVLVSAPDGPSVALWVDAAHPWVEVFTADTVPEAHRRRRSLGLEPMTCPPDAFRTGEDVVRLAPGATHTARWGLDPFVHLRSGAER